MFFAHYQYDSTSLDLPEEADSRLKEALRLLSRDVFENWSQKFQPGNSPSDNVELKAHLSFPPGGRSAVGVYQLDFYRQHTMNKVVNFIVRVHSGENAGVEAKRERDIVSYISTHAPELFSSSLLDGQFSMPHAVVYYHAESQHGSPTVPLDQLVMDALRSGDRVQISRLSQTIRRTCKGIASTFCNLDTDVKVVSGSKYFSSVRKRLLPDVIIDAQNSEVDLRVSEEAMVIPSKDGSFPPPLDRLTRMTGENLLAALDGHSGPPPPWFRLKAVRERVSSGQKSFLRFEADGVRIWLRLDGATVDADSFSKRCECDIVFHSAGMIQSSPDTTIYPSINFFVQRGSEQEACLSTRVLEHLCEGITEKIHLGVGHTDLHTGNILGSADGLKVIDLGSLDWDLLSVVQARLEVSLWSHIALWLSEAPHRIPPPDIERLLERLSGRHDIELEPQCEPVFEIIDSIREGIREGMAGREMAPVEASLAYVTQVVLHQRYFLERYLEAAPTSTSDIVPEAFQVVSRFWIKQFKDGPASLHTPDAPPLSDPVEHDVALNALDVLVHPNLHDLWQEALRSPRTGIVGHEASLFLEWLTEQRSDFSGLALTALQHVIWNASATLKPFQAKRHVIIAAPTSSGKSTVAEMFLAGPHYWGGERRCSLYIAPTRALAQAKWRDLRSLFQQEKHIHDGIVLSTGEDGDEDWRINSGRFTIACMVNEKASVLFSQSQRLMSNLACVVVDEMHMLMDLERGPTLEMALTKVLEERRAIAYQERREDSEDTLRIVAISTEHLPDEATIRFFSLPDLGDDDDESAPFVFHEPTRPVIVHHNLLLAGKNDEKFTVIPIVNFRRMDDRSLNGDQLQEIDRRLHDETRAIEQYGALYSSRAGQSVEAFRVRLVDFLMSLIDRNPRGYRVLVFMPGKADVEAIASQLRVQRSRRFTGTRKQDVRFMKNHTELEQIAENVEDQNMAKLVLRCAGAGVFIHHSDVDRLLRSKIEDLCSATPVEDSEIVVATETLSYGVNLAINDVILFGVKFNTATRQRHTTLDYLSSSAFHNMVGRAGRMGKTGAKAANVYLMLDEGEKPFKVIERYYTRAETAKSRLFVKDDKGAILRDAGNILAPRLDGEAADASGILKSTDFSYPFVRSVLDGLRHLNMPNSHHATQSAKKARTMRDVLSIFSNTLYASQFLTGGPTRERDLFTKAVRYVLTDCTKPTLKLVELTEAEDPKYTITDRGEAIIDTGTEIHTVEPLLDLVSRVRKIWADQHGGQEFPNDLYVLCLVAQEEILRQYIRYAPECRKVGGRVWSRQMSEDNRKNVFRSFVQSLQTLGIADVTLLASKLVATLEHWPLRASFDRQYPDGDVDSMLRYFNAIVVWINGAIYRDVLNMIETGPKAGGEENANGKMQGFRQFTEQFSYKVLFLVKMLATEKDENLALTPADERYLHLLVSRVRLGCIPEAIPLFWPHGSNVTRTQAGSMLTQGVTPDSILSSNQPEVQGVIKQHTLERLRRDLEKYAVKQIEELASEMTFVRDNDPKREAIYRLWSKLANFFLPASIGEFRSNGGGEAIGFDDFLKEFFDFRSPDDLQRPSAKPGLFLGSSGKPAADNKFRVRLENPSNVAGIRWYTERATGNMRDFEPHQDISILGVQFLLDWRCRVGRGDWSDLADIIAAQSNIRHLVLVALPWMPAAASMPSRSREALSARISKPGFSTSIVTPAAFAVMVSSIVRLFVTGEIFTDMMVSQKSGQPYGIISLQNIQGVLDEAGVKLPPAIRERIIQHFEVALTLPPD